MIRFQARTCRTGFLQDIRLTLYDAIAYATRYRDVMGAPCFVVDMTDPGPDRIVWRGGEVSTEALAHVARHAPKRRAG
jgi:hypothetical protein